MTEPLSLDSPILEELATVPSILIALDFDGTLAPLVDDPEASRMTLEARGALEALTLLDGVTVALVSGRAIESLLRVAEPMEQWFLVGSHGIEVLSPGESEGYVTPWLVPTGLEEGFRAVVSRYGGTRLEVKPFGVALHTRGVEESTAREAEAEAMRVCDAWDGDLVVRRGHGIVEASIRDAHKGDGVSALIAKTGTPEVLFAGDDVTDEDGFAALKPTDVSIRVGEGNTRARYRVSGTQEMAAILWSVYESRTAQAGK
jgi:trehalose 6-phosphate phosphatase